MRTKLGCVAVACLLALPVAGAGSGTLWYRCTTRLSDLQCATETDLLPAMQVSAAGPVTLTITSQSGGTMALAILDPCGNPIYSTSLSFTPYSVSSQSVIFTVPAPGVYRLRPGGDIWQGRFRFFSTTAKFVMPQGIDWDPYPDAVAVGSGSYYFYVPAGTTEFTFRVHSGYPLGGPEWGAAAVFDPNGALRLSVPQGQGDRFFQVAVPAGSSDGFWRADLTHRGDLRFYVTGIPAFFAEAPEAWFMPDVSLGASSANVGDHVTADTAVFCSGVIVEFLSLVDGAVVGTSDLTANDCGHFGFTVPDLPAAGYRVRISGCGFTRTFDFAIGATSTVPALDPFALALLAVMLAITAAVVLRR